MNFAMRLSRLDQLGSSQCKGRPESETSKTSLQPPDAKRKKCGPQPLVMKRPSAILNPDRPRPVDAWEKEYRSQIPDITFQHLIDIFLNRANLNYENMRLPSYDLHGTATHYWSKGKPLPKHWTENVRQRLEQRSESLWKTLFRYNAPDLLEEIEQKSLHLPFEKSDLPEQFWGKPGKDDKNEIQNMRRELLFQWSRDPANLRALDFCPERDSVVIDGHSVQAPWPALSQYRSCVLGWFGGEFATPSCVGRFGSAKGSDRKILFDFGTSF